MKTILVTGGIGSGKSEVCRHLASCGYPVYDCDTRSKQLYDEIPGLWNYVSSSLEVSDKKELARKIFNDSSSRDMLESVLYPILKDDILEWKADLTAPMAFIESAVAAQKPLFRDTYDYVLFVESSVQERILRSCKRDSSDRDSVLLRMRAQEEEPLKADFILKNDSDLPMLRKRTSEFLNNFKLKLSI